MRVDFMMIGAQKCGTTTLAEQVAAHPQICFCSIKEPGYFSETVDWQAHLAAYHSLYTPTAGQLCGEGSTMYTFLPEYSGTHDRLYAYNPALKLIYIMRHPVERVLSNYAHRLVRKTTHLPLEQAVFADPVYLNRSRYGVQLRPYLARFPRQNILPLIFEEMIADQAGALRQVANFLGISPAGFEATDEASLVTHRSVGDYQLTPFWQRVREIPVMERALHYLPSTLRSQARRQLGNTLSQKPQVTAEFRHLLWQFLEDDVCTVEQILGRPLHQWRQGYTESALPFAKTAQAGDFAPVAAGGQDL